MTSFAQLGVGTNTPDASAQLDVTATDKGFLAPRIALTDATDVTTIATPATGLMIYNTATAGTSPNNVFPGYYYYNGTRWSRFVNTALNATVSFSTADPNSGSPTFTPNSPQSTDYIYVSAVNSSLWVWDGSAYVLYAAPGNTPFYKNSTTTDAGGDKISGIYRTGSISIGTNNTTRLLDVVNTASSYAGLIEAEGFVNNSYSRAIAIRMRRGTSASPTALQLNDVSAYGFAGHDGTSFSTTSAGMAGIATQNWTSSAKGMALIFSTTQNATTTLTERMRIDNNGNIGVGTTAPISTLSNTSIPIQGTNSSNAFNGGLTWSTPGTGFAGSFYSQPSNGNGLLVKIAGNSSSNNAFEVASSVSQESNVNNPIFPLFNVLGNGNVGIRTSAPATTLHMNSNLAATNTVNVDGQMLRLMRPQTPAVKWENIAQFNLGSYSTNINSNSRLDLAMNDGGSASTSIIMTWLANGRVGVNTTDPVTPLHIVGAFTEDITSQDNFSNGINIRKRGNSSAATGAVASGAEIGYHSFYGWNGTGYARGAYVFVSAAEAYTSSANGTNYAILTTANGTTANVERFKIMHNGNVGIGTGNPNGALTLYGPSSLALPANIQGATGATKELVFGRGGLFSNLAAITGIDNGQYGGGLSFIVKPSGTDNFPTNAIQAMVLDWNGNMGIGTGSPSQRLDVNGQVRIRTINSGATTDSLLVVNGGVVKSVSRSATVNTQSGNYTLTTSDNGSVLIMNSASAVTVTVPATLPAGFVVQIIQKGAGQVTVTGSGSTINSANGFKTRTLNSAIGVVMESSTLGYVTGDSNF